MSDDRLERFEELSFLILSSFIFKNSTSNFKEMKMSRFK